MIMVKAVVSVIGKDKTGIIYGVSKALFENNINILDISQTVMQDMFTMVMLVDIENSAVDFTTLIDILQKTGEERGVKITVCHEEIFNSMHRI